MSPNEIVCMKCQILFAETPPPPPKKKKKKKKKNTKYHQIVVRLHVLCLASGKIKRTQ